MESYFVEVKQQMTSLYFEYAQKADEWETREKEMKTETTALIAERDNLALKLKRVEEAIDMISAETNKGGDTAGTIARLEDKIKEYTRKVTVYEVNEAVLSRKFMALSEQMAEEQSLRARVEADFVEMEGTLKRRILFLEQYKAICSPRLDKLETELQYSVPQSDFIAIQNELESLREDHLFALRRELEARVGSFDSHER
ncbi:cep290, partial [Symbiodinium microadriaticum]